MEGGQPTFRVLAASVQLIDNALYEPNEHFIIKLERDPSLTHFAGIADDHQINVTIVDKDPPPQLVLSVDSATVAEAAGSVTVTLTASGTGYRAEQNFDLKVSGTAADGDYTLSSNEIVIPAEASATSSSATLTAVANTVDAPNKTVIITAEHREATAHAKLADSNATVNVGDPLTVTIPDDDGAPGQVKNLRTTTTGGEARLEWDVPIGAEPITSYKIEWSATGASAWATLATTTGTTTTHTDTTWTVADERHYRVSAVNAEGTGPVSNVAIARGAPAVTAVAISSTPSAGDTYGIGETIEVSLTFDLPVVVSGRPWISLDIGSGTDDDVALDADGSARRADYVSGSGGAVLVFHYTVQLGDIDSGVVEIREGTGITLADGGRLQSANNFDAVLSLPRFSAQPAHKVNGGKPLVRFVELPTSLDELDHYIFRLERTGALEPRLEGHIDFVDTGDDDDVSLNAFKFSPSARHAIAYYFLGDDSEDPSSRTVQGKIVANDGFEKGPDTRLIPVIDRSRVVPRVSVRALDPNVTEGTAPSFYFKRTSLNSSDLVVALNVQESGNTLGTVPASVTITIPGGAQTAALSIPTDDDTDDEQDSLITVTVLSGPGYAAIAGETRTATTRVRDNDEAKLLSVAISSSPLDDTYGEDERIWFTLTFNGVVNVDDPSSEQQAYLQVQGFSGSPNWRRAEYLSGSGTATLVFAYAVEAADRSSAGISVGPSVVFHNSNEIRSAADGREADLRHTGLGVLAGHKVDGSIRSSAPSTPMPTVRPDGNSGLVVQWEASQIIAPHRVLGYDLRYLKMGETAWIDQAGLSGLEYTVRGLENGVEYEVQVRAYSNAQQNREGRWSARVRATPTGPAAPDAPVVSARASNEQLTLSWEAPFDGGRPISYYEYRVRESSGSVWNPDWRATSAHSVTVRNLTNGTTYIAQVRAVNNQGGGAAGTATGTPTDRRTVPEFTVVITINGDAQVTLNWTEPFDGGSPILRYEYRYQESGGGTWTDVEVVRGGGSARQETIPGLTNGTTYLFRLWAVNELGDGARSSAVGRPAGPVSPDAPVVSVVVGNGQLTLSWEAPFDGGSPISYYEYRYQDHAAGGALTRWAATGARSVTVRNLTNGTAYIVQVRAVNNQGDGAAGTVIGTPTGQPHSLPVVTVTAGDGHLMLTWTAPNDGGSPISSYEYRVRPSNGPTWNPDWTRAGGVSARSFKVTGLTNDTAYTVEVRAVNGGGTATGTPVGP